MKFHLETVYSDVAKEVLDEYYCVKKFPIETESITKYSGQYFECHYETAYIHINTLEELIELQKLVGYPLIITEGDIEIYDGYRE